MARGRDLAGLAALAGLAYMANKKGKGQETTGVDPGAAMGAGAMDAGDYGYGDASGAAVDTAAMADMGPRGSRAKVNTETGDLYYPEGAPAPARAAPTRSAAAAPARPNIVSREEGMKNYVPRRKPSAGTVSSSEEGMKGYVPRRTPKPLTEVRRPGTQVNYENTDTSDMTYKKGGKTKKMASGGVASASKRADGIASRGKTKCKMY